MKIHIVRSGDSLKELAKKYQLSEEQIVAANPSIKNDQPLKQGSKIFIPTGKIPLAKEEEKKEQSVVNQDEPFDKPQESSSSIESSYQQEEFSESPYFPMQSEAFASEHIPSPPIMPPFSPIPPAFYDYSYQWSPPNPYSNIGYLNAMPVFPYYYPHLYGPYGQAYGESYDPFQSSYESSSYFQAFNDQSKWNRYWSEKESSSIEG